MSNILSRIRNFFNPHNEIDAPVHPLETVRNTPGYRVHEVKGQYFVYNGGVPVKGPYEKESTAQGQATRLQNSEK